MSSQLDRIEKKVDEHIAESTKTSKKVEDMYFTIMGNPDAEVKGLAHKVSDHATYISNDKKFKWIAAGAMGGTNFGFFAWIKYHLGL